MGVAGPVTGTYSLEDITDDPELDFSIIERAGLTQSEFAGLADVTRVTINHWVSGKGRPARKKEPKIKSLLKVLSVANKRGILPDTLPSIHKDHMDDRRAQIRKAIRAIVKSRKS